MSPIERLVAFFGGQTKTATALGVSQAAVSHWVSGAHSMSAAKAFLAEDLTKGAVTARELASPTLNETIRPTDIVRQTGNPPVQTSSTAQASA
ncbi:helix-turn-helix domain-containing protein [Pseudomonas sp. TNT2022 ID357]|uniref:Helix-turn-helix domain-containing protein n=1 Tax=Pseudomonas idahonensis TaxID=2942628 RepID=A0ABT5Q843_9PSED|nr:Cro/CI family transcriptional regulator [Pseudomonas idahonensis]MDD1150374.1 helix-turn-helix domain-containing protein [Pseudomonas idahonensis]